MLMHRGLVLPTLVLGLLLALVPGTALAKGCEPNCVRFVLDGVPVAGQPVGVRVIWVDDAGQRVSPSADAYNGRYSVFFWPLRDLPGNLQTEMESKLSGRLMDRGWRINHGITGSWEDLIWTPIGVGRLTPDRDPPLEVAVHPDDGTAHSGAVRFPDTGLWVGQIRPPGAWPTTPYGSDPTVVRVEPNLATKSSADSVQPSVLLAVGGVLAAGAALAARRRFGGRRTST